MKTTEGKDSFVMYGSFLEAAETLNGDDFKECILKLRDYALYGTDSKSENSMVNAILIMAKPNLKAAAERYDRCVMNGKKGGEFGSMGGRPRKGETKEEYEQRKGLEKTPRKPLNGNDTENGNVDENEKGKGNGNEDVEDKPLNCPEDNLPEEPSYLPFPSSYLSSSSPSPSTEEQATEEQVTVQGHTDAEIGTFMEALKPNIFLLARNNLGLKEVNNPQALYYATLNRVCEFYGCAKEDAEPWVARQISRAEDKLNNRCAEN